MWDIIETAFGGDETANFGPRKETGSALYQIDTIATVSCQDQENVTLPIVSASVLEDLTCLAVEKNLILQASSILKFDNNIEEVDWSPDGTLIVMGLTGGMLYLLNAESTDVIFSMNLVPEERHVDNRAFRKIVFSATGDLVILTADGQLIVQLAIQIPEDGNIGELIKKNVRMASTKSYHSVVTDVVVVRDYIYTVGSGDCILARWNFRHGSIEIDDYIESDDDHTDLSLMKVKASSDGHFVFTLDSNHHLSIWDATMMVSLRTDNDMRIVDICLLETNTSQTNSLGDMKLVVLTAPDNGECFLKVKTLSDWETVYNLQLSAPCFLSKCSTFQDTLFFSEFCGNNAENHENFTTLRFRSLSETDPESRLYRILQKNKFDEAEKFANMFHLDMEMVHKVKANYLIDQLSPWNCNRYEPDRLATMVEQLWTCLDTIVDDLHAAERCMTVALPTFKHTEKLLNYCKQKLLKASTTQDPVVKEKQREMYCKFLEIQHRLVTFKLAFGEDTYSGEKWEQFMRVDLLQESVKWFDSGHLDCAFMIWTRHQTSWKKSALSCELIQKILLAIPYDTPCNDILGYLSTAIIPCVVRDVPDALGDVITFIVDRTKSMETRDKDNWPQSAIHFAQYLYKRLCDVSTVQMNDDICMAEDYADKTLLRSDTTLNKLMTLILKLKQLDDVLHKYKCRLTLVQFLKETRETIAFRMLDNVVALNLINQTLERQIQPYMREHGLNQDRIFSQYIKDLLERSAQIQSYRGLSAWEAKAAAIIDCISDVEQKVLGILEVMKWAALPWSSCVDQMVQMGLKFKHSSVKKIEEQCERVKVRKVMMKYGLKNCEVPQDHEVERLMYCMLTQDKPGCVEDALEVMNSCGLSLKGDLYSFRLRQLIDADRLEDSLELLQDLPTELAVKISKSLVGLTKVKLNHSIMFKGIENEVKRRLQSYTEAAILILKFLQTKTKGTLDLQELKDDEVMLRNMWALQVEFDTYLTTDEYNSESYRMKRICEYIEEFLKNKVVQTSGYMKIYRLARILQIPDTTIQGQLAIKYANVGDIETAVKICGELYESSRTQETAQTLFEVVQAFLSLQADTDIEDTSIDTVKLRLLPEVCSRLANQAVSICDADKISQYLELCKSCSLLHEVSQQCESGDATLSEQWGESTDLRVDKEMYNALTLDVFTEDASLISSTLVLPLVSKYVVQNPLLQPGYGNHGDVFPVQQYCDSLMPVLQHLRDNSHIQLAYGFSLHMMFTLLQYVLYRDMGFPLPDEQKEKIQQEWNLIQDLDKHSQAMIKDLVNTIVMKIFNGSKVDDKLAFTYLCTRPLREVMDLMMRLMKSSGQQFKKLKAIAGLGIALGEIFNSADMIAKCQVLEQNATWGYRLGKIKISFKDAILGPVGEKSKLLPSIAQSEAADTNLVREFCQSFKLDENDGLLLYLDHLFIQPEDVSFETEQNKPLVIARAREAISKIQDKDRLLQTVKKIYNRTSPYDYETIEFVLQVIADNDDLQSASDIPVQKGLELLDYLKVYPRHAPPAEYEVEFKMSGKQKESQIFMASLPKESKVRLPIHPLLHGDPWKIIAPELKRETVKTWLLMAKMLNISPDQICLLAVQNMVRVYTETFTSPDGGSDLSLWHWKPEQANKALLEDAGLVLKNIKNCESSLACSKWMISKLPLGSEKVMVLEQCVKIAELWHLSVPDDNAKKQKAKGAYVKFMSHWQKMASAQVLCLNSLGDGDMLQFTDKPSVLIQKLYEHPSITQLDWNSGASKPDIHGVAEKIAKICNVCLDTVHKTLMDKWLQSTSQAQQESDSTMTFSLDNLKLNETLQENMEKDEEENFKRIVFLVQQIDDDSNMMRLFFIALNQKDGHDTACCISALRCILYLCNDEMTQKLCNKSIKDIRDLLHVTIYLSSLEKLHIRHTVDTFTSCNKNGLVKGIWKNHSHEKIAVTLVSCLCLDYEIHDYQLWAGIFQRLLSFNLMTQLEYVLLRLNTVPHLWQVPSFSKMWYNIVSMHLLKVSSPLTKEETNSCVHYFNLLLSCPVVEDIDGPGLAKLYKKLELPACALGCLLVCKEQRDPLIQQMTSTDQQNILDNARNLLKHGLNKAMSLKIQQAVYGDVLHGERFATIQGALDQKQLLMYCVDTRNIDPLLQFVIKHQRLTEAKTIVKVYLNTATDVYNYVVGYVDEEDSEEDEDLALLKGYLRMQGLSESLSMIYSTEDP